MKTKTIDAAISVASKLYCGDNCPGEIDIGNSEVHEAEGSGGVWVHAFLWVTDAQIAKHIAEPEAPVEAAPKVKQEIEANPEHIKARAYARFMTVGGGNEYDIQIGEDAAVTEDETAYLIEARVVAYKACVAPFDPASIGFPFEEIRQESGDFFDSIGQARAAGFEDSQIWSVVEGENDVFCYGPPRHCINRLGYVATKEHHDDNTYYYE